MSMKRHKPDEIIVQLHIEQHLFGFYQDGFGNWWANSEGVMRLDMIVLFEPLIDDCLIESDMN